MGNAPNNDRSLLGASLVAGTAVRNERGGGKAQKARIAPSGRARTGGNGGAKAGRRWGFWISQAEVGESYGGRDGANGGY